MHILLGAAMGIVMGIIVLTLYQRQMLRSMVGDAINYYTTAVAFCSSHTMYLIVTLHWVLDNMSAESLLDYLEEKYDYYKNKASSFELFWLPPSLHEDVISRRNFTAKSLIDLDGTLSIRAPSWLTQQ